MNRHAYLNVQSHQSIRFSFTEGMYAFRYTLVNVYVDLLVFTRIAGTS